MGITDWLYPGATVKHYAYKKETQFTETIARAIAIIIFKHDKLNYYSLVSIERIAIDPDYCGGKPRIAGTRIPVATIAQLYLEIGETKDRRSALAALKAIATEYDLSLAAVYAAMAYYYDHKEEIDRHTAESRAWVEQMKHNSFVL